MVSTVALPDVDGAVAVDATGGGRRIGQRLLDKTKYKNSQREDIVPNCKNYNSQWGMLQSSKKVSEGEREREIERERECVCV